MLASSKIYEFLRKSLVFVSIGSIADVMPMIDENRIMTRYGLEFMGATDHPGLNRLIYNSTTTSKTVSWELSPLLNSPGRYGQTELTERFFLSKNTNELDSVLNKIRSLNDKRKALVNETVQTLIQDIENGFHNDYNNFYCVVIDDIPEGLAGLLAQRISDYYNRPAIILTGKSDTAIDAYKGSGRSLNGIDFFSYIMPMGDMFERIGGHAQAFGFTIQKNNVSSVMSRLDASLEGNVVEQIIHADIELDITRITQKLLAELLMLDPFGKGNHEPVFFSQNVKISDFARFGIDKNHGKFLFAENAEVSAVGWKRAEVMEMMYNNGSAVDILYTLEKNKFNNRNYIQMNIVDIDRYDHASQ